MGLCVHVCESRLRVVRAMARVLLAAPQVLVRLGVVMQLVAKMRLHALVSMTCIGCTSNSLA